MNHEDLTPYQNTVTNALYFVLTARISRYPGNSDQQFVQAMESEFQFLQT